jgi:hypothetical protein
MENRIRRLAFEQQRSSNLTVIATKKAENLLESKVAHEENLQLRANRKQQRLDEKAVMQRNILMVKVERDDKK